MRILMLTDVYFPRINGVSTSIESFRLALAKRDIRVDVLAPTYPLPYLPDEQVIRVPSWPVPFDPEDRLMHRRPLRLALQQAASRQYDLVHIQTPFAAHYAGLDFASTQGLPCVATYHTHFEEYLHNYVPVVPQGILRHVARQLARRQCNALDAVIVPSRAMEETLTDYGVTTPMYRVPTGIPVEQFRRPASADFSSSFRQRHGIPNDAPMALFVGRAAHEKNIGFLLEAIPYALQRCPQLVMTIAGEGPALPALKRQAQQLGIEAQVIFVGYLDRQTELPACYAAADIFSFASRTETQGLVLLEAMAAGLPVLAFSCLGTREIIEPRRGALPAPETPAEFGKALADLAHDTAMRERMALDAVAFAETWTTQTCAQRMADVYRTLTA